ncbi:MAG TPA: hypothetical protein VGV41_22310 [Pseudolabrys sp.]|uniref:hypothetical protein n=1 Tax=Pseudolabrys sp. TaxID=1960880 RepID=UPI002DDC9122|nr:hypothetical protein [Pseudolabrys sp.]HEV2631366.1 hypothetical protein [Pseudolabrys sp.]
MAISPIGSVTTSFAIGGGTPQPRGADALAMLAQSGMLRTLDNSRSGIDRIKAALTGLRDALQTARGTASAVPGGTELTPIVAQIEQTQDQPTFVTVNGQPVQNGTITVSLGTRPVVVGYEAGNRPSLAVHDAVRALASSVAQVVATVGGATRGFASDVSALLKSRDLATAMNAPDVASIDAALGQIDGVLAKADGLRSTLASQASATALVDLGGALLAASGDAQSRR